MMTPCKLVDISPLTRVKWPNFLTGYVPTTTILTLSCNGELCWVPKFERYELGKILSHISKQQFSLKEMFTGTWKKQSYSFLFPVFQEKESPKIPKRTYESFNSMWSFLFLKAVIHPTTHIFQPFMGHRRLVARPNRSHRLALRCGTRCWGYDYHPTK